MTVHSGLVPAYLLCGVQEGDRKCQERPIHPILLLVSSESRRLARLALALAHSTYPYTY